MVTVKKRDGRTELFVPEKIVASALKTGATVEYSRTISQEIERSAGKSITTDEIRTKALEMLKEENPAWERNWTVYDEAVKKR